MYKKMTIFLNEILISSSFEKHPPKGVKIAKALNYYRENGVFDQAIKLNEDGVLVNGYARYVAAKMLGLTEVEVIQKGKNPNCYVFGYHPTYPHKEYVWKLKARDYKSGFGELIHPGDRVLVNAKNIKTSIVVTKVEVLENPPVDGIIKSVVL